MRHRTRPSDVGRIRCRLRIRGEYSGRCAVQEARRTGAEIGQCDAGKRRPHAHSTDRRHQGTDHDQGGHGCPVRRHGFDDGAGGPTGRRLTYQWSFGDGGSATGATVIHKYTRSMESCTVIQGVMSAAHPLDVTLVVADGALKSAPAVQKIRICP